MHSFCWITQLSGHLLHGVSGEGSRTIGTHEPVMGLPMALTCSSSRPCTVRVWLMVLSRGSTVLACSCTAASSCASSSSATVRRPANAPTAGGMLHEK